MTGALATAAFLLTLTAGQTAVGAAAADGPVGGPQLGTGLAVNLAAGIKGLPAMLTPKAWLVADLDTGQVLGAYDAHAAHRPASTLKTLAALALIPKLDPAAQVPFTAAELALTAQKDGRTTRLGLVPGSSYPVKRLFEAMLSLSANDATEALAGAAPGGRTATLASMNAIADTLQARDTHAATPDGLDGPGQQISAYDLALIARAALAVPGFTAYNTVPIVHVPSAGKPLGGGNHDRLQNSASLLHGASVIAGKDGYTTESGQVWWGAASKNGHRIIVTEMDAGFEPVTQEINLLNWGFDVDGKIAPVGALVPPVSAAGVPEPLASITSSAPAAAPVKPVATAHKTKSGSGPWPWILGFLIVLAAATLGRRHFLASRSSAGAAPVGRRTSGSADGRRAGAGVARPGDPASPPKPVTPADTSPAQPVPAPAPVAVEQSVATTPAPPALPSGPRRPAPLKPWQAPVSDRSVILRNASALGPSALGTSAQTRDAEAAPAGQRLEAAKLEAWRAARAEPATTAQARADRLRSGAVKVIPAPTSPTDEPAPRNSL